jgi:predicted transcriptional regulator
MKKRESITHIMSTDLQTVNITQSLTDVKEIFETHQVRHVPVVQGGKVLGLISKTDLMRVTFGASQAQIDHTEYSILQGFKIEDVMTKNVAVVSHKSDIREAAETFSEFPISSLPVVDENEKLVGIVTTTDMIRYLLSQY